MKITYVASKFETAEKTLEKMNALKMPYTETGLDYKLGEYECTSEEDWAKWYIAERAEAMDREGFLYVYIFENGQLRAPAVPMK